MNVEFVLGRRKSGKSFQIAQRIKKHIDTGEMCYLMVPEQNTLDTENKLLTTLNYKGLLDIQVLSFKKLGTLLLKNTGLRLNKFLTEQGQLLLLNKITVDLESKLSYFKKAKPSTIEELNKVLSSLRDLDSYDIDAAKLEKSPLLKQKIKEIGLIRERYEEYLKDGYIDDIELNEKLLDVIGEDADIRNSHIFVDDFFSFSNKQMRILEKLISHAKSFTITFNVDIKNMEFNGGGIDLYRHLRKYAENMNISCRTTMLDKKHYKSSNLEKLENMLCYNKFLKSAGNEDSITISSHTNIDEEVKETFKKIIRMKDQGIEYRDMKIVCNNLDAYRNYFKLYRRLYDVPLFIDEKVFIHNHSISRLLISMINLLDDTRTQDIITILKSGFLDFQIDEIERLEKYVKENGINYAKWLRPFLDAEEIEITRKKVAYLLKELRINIKGSKVEDKVSSIYNMLTKLNIYGILSDRIEKNKEEGNYKNVYIDTQYWNTLLEIFDQLVSFLGSRNISNSLLAQLLRNVLATQHLSLLPVNDNEVLVINSQDAFKESAEVLFITGANEGYLPERISPEPLFPLEETRIMEELLGWKKDEISKQSIRNMELYFTLTMASLKMHVSYSTSDSQGSGIKPAYILKQIKNAFTQKPDSKVKEDEDNYYYSPKISIIELIKNSRTRELEVPKDIYEKVLVKYKELLDNIYSFNKIERNEGYIDKEIAAIILFNKNEPYFSISKLEEYGKCPYSFFIKYGLRPEEEREFDIKSMDIGNIYHHVLEKIGENNWFLTDDLDIAAKVEQIFNGEYETRNLYKYDSNQLNYRLGRIREEGLKFIDRLIEDIRNSSYKPLYHEVEFGPGGTFPEYRLNLAVGTSFHLEGKVDRVDSMKLSTTEYIRIIDYKLKNKKMDYRKFRDGIAFQLFVYLNALSAGSYKPAGVIYNNLLDNDGEKGMTGLLLTDENLEQHLPPGFSENNTIAPFEYDLIRKFTESKIKEQAGKIIDGDFKVAPYFYKNDERGCKYCRYLKICKNKKISRALPAGKYDKKAFIEELTRKYAKLD